MFREDYETAHGMSDAERRNLYANLKSGAESGWDFSSRWYIVDNGSVAGDLTHLRTRHIVPVDLNAFLCMNARLLSNMFALVGDQSRAQLYGRVFLDWKEAIHKVPLSDNLIKRLIHYELAETVRFCRSPWSSLLPKVTFKTNTIAADWRNWKLRPSVNLAIPDMGNWNQENGQTKKLVPN